MIENGNLNKFKEEPEDSIPPFGLNKLLSYDEFLHIRKRVGNSVTGSYIKGIKFEFNRWFNAPIITPDIFYKKYLNGEFDRNIKNWKWESRFIKEYILVNMLWNRITFDKEFIKGQTMRTGLPARMNYLQFHYKLTKPDFLPSYNEIKWKSNTFFAFELSLFYKKEDLSDEVILNCLMDSYSKANYENLEEKFKDFSIIFYPIFVKHSLMKERSNIFEYLYKKRNNNPLNDEEKVWNYFDQKMKALQDTEFHIVGRSFVEECLSKKSLHISSIKQAILAWGTLTDICLLDTIEPCTSVKEINGYHRDCLIDIYGDGIKSCISFIRKVLSHYNSNYVKDKMYFDIDLFKYADLPSKVVENSKVQLMETGMGALCSAIYEAILFSRKKHFKEMAQRERTFFYTVRILWFTCIYAGRISEILKLKLIDVENSVKYKKPYILINTLKDSHNRPIEIDRGEKLDNFANKHEYDWLHYDILKETISASKFVFHQLDSVVDTKYLFPGIQIHQHISSGTISNFYRNIQIKNGIVAGSSYDIRNRELYLYHPHLKKLLGDPLFKIHNFRHFTVEILRKYALLTKEEITRFYGWKSSNTENSYGEYSKAGFKVFKVLEREGHIDASNKLVSSTIKREISSDVNRAELADIEDLERHFHDVDSGNFINIDDANKHIDENTDCQTEIACGDTGIRCTGCEHFRTGEETTMKKDAIAFIMEDAYKKIDQEIQNLNLDKKDLLKKSKGSKKLLVDAFVSILIRFEEIEATKNTSLLSKQQGFGWSEATANRFLMPLFKKIRKTDLDKLLINRIKELRSDGYFEDRIEELRGEGDFNSFDIKISLYRNIENKVVFR
ncbi:hypothetical protein AB9M93_25310 [Peribacillus frigoritolerans]|uniref:hypothetical protein n=1 Tax=Peribacillus frigoritolerans TaxID=450367 RepID=UPI0035133EC6